MGGQVGGQAASRLGETMDCSCLLGFATVQRWRRRTTALRVKDWRGQNGGVNRATTLNALFALARLALRHNLLLFNTSAMPSAAARWRSGQAPLACRTSSWFIVVSRHRARARTAEHACHSTTITALRHQWACWTWFLRYRPTRDTIRAPPATGYRVQTTRTFLYPHTTAPYYTYGHHTFPPPPRRPYRNASIPRPRSYAQ